ncbi:hypothetical protein RSOLAG1IB_06248 [Rhizoctonia solani AG-1 IB]|uniref:Uncharacterized protein n=1 Tax=Thanatephorus cucumeris (strain AG1-IB / isolate 7/3/14) TaxID=1108050 RepID=A0A0B7F5D0_THACB|nr:hypothetical protein RSOLAG1IB_06248 [Rhizoctonia solani AG-1 IB]
MVKCPSSLGCRRAGWTTVNGLERRFVRVLASPRVYHNHNSLHFSARINVYHPPNECRLVVPRKTKLRDTTWLSKFATIRYH